MFKPGASLLQCAVVGLLTGSFTFTTFYIFLLNHPGFITFNPGYFSFCLCVPALVLGKYYVDSLRKNESLANDLNEQQEYIAELEEYKYALDNSAIIAVIDEKGKFKRVNENFAALTGFQSQDVIGRFAWRLHSSLKSRGAFQEIKKLTDNGSIWKGEIEYYKNDGSIIYTSTIVVPLSQKVDGNNICLAIGYDITSQRHAQALAQAEVANQSNFTNQLLNESENLLCVVDEHEQIKFVNTRLKEFFRFDKKMSVNTITEMVNFNADSVLLLKPEEIKRGLPNAKSVYECRLKNIATGEFQWFKVQRKVFTDKFHKKNIFLIATDISEKQATQVRLIKANESAEASLKVKEQFIANMSHEIRTPLNAIIGFTDLLDDTLLDEQQKDYVQTINISGQNLLGIINDILDLSKLESGKIEFANQPMNVPLIIENVKKIFEPKIREKKIFLDTVVSEALPEIVYGDKTRLTQILVNLIGNAVKFTNHGGISISVNEVKGTGTDKTHMQFSVKDSGIGIEKERHDVIFQRYSQASVNIHQVYGGTGLGLSISKNLVDSLGGKMNLVSDIGIGTTISFVMPFNRYTATGIKENLPAVAQQAIPLEKPIKILLAEDNNVNAKLAIQLLKKKNFVVERVRDGKEVVDMLRQHSYDLILMDVQMIEQDGIETTKIIRSSTLRQNNIPIIALTAHSFVGEKEVCSKAGMNAYISKPFRPEELYNTITEIVFEQGLINKVA